MREDLPTSGGYLCIMQVHKNSVADAWIRFDTYDNGTRRVTAKVFLKRNARRSQQMFVAEQMRKLAMEPYPSCEMHAYGEDTFMAFGTGKSPSTGISVEVEKHGTFCVGATYTLVADKELVKELLSSKRAMTACSKRAI